MTHKQVLKAFVSLFPQYADQEFLYFPNGRNSIRLRGLTFPAMHIRQDMVFTCNYNCTEWKFETVNNYLAELKEKIKHA